MAWHIRKIVFVPYFLLDWNKFFNLFSSVTFVVRIEYIKRFSESLVENGFYWNWKKDSWLMLMSSFSYSRYCSQLFEPLHGNIQRQKLRSICLQMREFTINITQFNNTANRMVNNYYLPIPLPIILEKSLKLLSESAFSNYILIRISVFIINFIQFIIKFNLHFYCSYIAFLFCQPMFVVCMYSLFHFFS